MMKKCIIFTISLTFICVAGLAQTKSVTLRTYYPEPIGSYARIQLMNDTTTTLTASCPIGSLLKRTIDQTDALLACYENPAVLGTGEWKFLQGVWSYTLDFCNSAICQNTFLSDAASHVGIGTENPNFKLTIHDTGSAISPTDVSGGILALDFWNNGDILTSQGAGTRFLWHPKKTALRAGTITSVAPDFWDDNNIGLFSVSFGSDTKSSGEASMVLSGENNQAEANYSTISGGQDNLININSTSGTIAGGRQNTIDGENSLIGGGVLNRIENSNNAVIIGGGIPTNTNLAEDNIISNSADAGIGGGISHSISSSIRSTIIGGENNALSSASSCSIGGGQNNSSSGSVSTYSMIGGGFNNRCTKIYGALIGGFNNVVSADSSAILGGGGDNGNRILNGRYAAIIGGENNLIDYTPVSDPNNWSSVIVGGSDNKIYFHGSFIGGGKGNTINANVYFSGIGGGLNNTISAMDATIGGGRDNHCRTRSSIPGGQNNRNSNAYAWVGGQNMYASGMQQFLWGHRSSQMSMYKMNSFIVFSGDVGIMTTAPQAKLDVRGHAHASGKLYLSYSSLPSEVSENYLQLDADGKFFSSFDLAETFQTSHDVSPGHVLSANPNADNVLQKSAAPYDPNVIGIVSSSPAVILKGQETIMGPELLEQSETGTTAPPVALKGRVPVKVTLENGPIEPGDPLTTSSVPGHAMKSTDWEKSFGTTIGKALEGFSGGPNGETEGVIITFVTLY